MSEWRGYSRTAPYCHHAYCDAGELGGLKGGIVRAEKRRAPTSAGWRMLQAIPLEGISEHDLIEKLGGLDSYENYQQGITELIRTKYLTLENGLHKRA